MIERGGSAGDCGPDGAAYTSQMPSGSDEEKGRARASSPRRPSGSIGAPGKRAGAPRKGMSAEQGRKQGLGRTSAAGRTTAAGRSTGGVRGERSEGRAPLPKETQKWGNVARRGAYEVRRSNEEHRAKASEEQARGPSGPPPPMDRWVRVDGGESDDDRRRAAPPHGSLDRSTRSSRQPFEPRPLPGDVAASIRRAADTATARRREVLVDKMAHAVAAYDRGRFGDAARLAKQVAAEVPGVPEVRQLAGLAAYRCGSWREAARQLEEYGRLADSVAHLPPLMDCYRAMGRTRKVAEVWEQVRRRSPTADVLAEARIVAAGMQSDRGRLADAIELLASGGAARSLRNPAGRHLRQWYVLADLYERAGDVPRARELFTRVLRADPDAYDAADRLALLGPAGDRRPARRRSGTATGRSRPRPDRMPTS